MQGLAIASDRILIMTTRPGRHEIYCVARAISSWVISKSLSLLNAPLHILRGIAKAIEARIKSLAITPIDSGFDTLNVQAVDVLTAAEYPWRQAAENVAISGLEIRTNSGESRIINFVKAKIKNAQNSFRNNMSADIYSDGAASNQINGLQALVSDAGTGIVGGINSTTFTFWKSILQSAASPLQGGGAITPSATTMESLMLPLWIKLTRGADMPDLIVMDPIYFSYFEQSQTSLKRYAPEDKGQAGMISMKYKTADVFFDAATLIPASHAYFLNTDFLELVVHKDANMTMMDDLRAINQDAVVTPILWMGNVACSARFLQGLVKA